MQEGIDYNIVSGVGGVGDFGVVNGDLLSLERWCGAGKSILMDLHVELSIDWRVRVEHQNEVLVIVAGIVSCKGKMVSQKPPHAVYRRRRRGVLRKGPLQKQEDYYGWKAAFEHCGGRKWISFKIHITGRHQNDREYGKQLILKERISIIYVSDHSVWSSWWSLISWKRFWTSDIG